MQKRKIPSCRASNLTLVFVEQVLGVVIWMVVKKFLKNEKNSKFDEI